MFLSHNLQDVDLFSFKMLNKNWCSKASLVLCVFNAAPLLELSQADILSRVCACCHLSARLNHRSQICNDQEEPVFKHTFSCPLASMLLKSRYHAKSGF